MTRLPDLPIEGGCACGQVRYRVNAQPAFVYTCHCTDCQTLSQSAFSLNAIIKREELEVTKGEPKTWVRTTTESGKPTAQHICPNCGVRMFSEPTGAPNHYTLRLGTLDDTTWLRPAAAIWMVSAQPWFEPTKDMLVYDKGFNPAEVAARYQEIMGRE